MLVCRAGSEKLKIVEKEGYEPVSHVARLSDEVEMAVPSQVGIVLVF